jgi:thiol-disulfide isomerase/thioredoxin
MVNGGPAGRRAGGPNKPTTGFLTPRDGAQAESWRPKALGPPARRPAGPPIVALVLALLAPRLAPAQETIGIAVGETPPAVVLEDLDGNAVDLAQWVGTRPVLVEFWATWCPLCAALEPRLREAQTRYGADLEILIVAVGVNQSPRSVRRHLARHELPGRVLWDGQGQAVRAFQTPSTSYVVALDASGRVVYTGVGEDQDLDAAARKALRR